MPNPATESGFSMSALLKRHLRLLSVLGLLLIAYGLIGFLLVPRLIDKYATAYVHDDMHRQLRLGAVRFNPFTLTVEISQAQLAEADGAPVFGFDYLLVNAELSSVFTGSYNFRKIQLDAPNVQVITSPQGQLNLAFKDLQKDSDSTAKAAPLPRVRIDELTLTGGHVHIDDQSRPTPFRSDLAPIQFTLENFRTEPEHGNDFHFTARSAAGESFDLQGDFALQPLVSKGRLQVAGLKAESLQSYLQDALPFRLLTGTISLDGGYEMSLVNELDLKLSLPNISVAASSIAPKMGDGAAWVSWANLGITGTEVALNKRSVQIQQVTLSDAQFTAVLDAQRNLNLLELLGPDEASDAPWSTRVKEIRLVNAAVQLEDQGVTPATRFSIKPAQVQVNDFNTAPDTTVNVNASMVINDKADLAFSGSVNLDTLSSQMKVKLAGLQLTDVQNYASTSTDMLIQDGQLSAEGDAYYKGTATNRSPAIKFTGNVEIANLNTQDKVDGKDFIKWQSLLLKNLNYSMTPDALEIDQVQVRKPYGRVIINSDGTTNFQQVLRTKGAAGSDHNSAVEVHAAATPPMRTRIAKVLIEGGSANFTDNTVQPVFSTGIQKLNGTVTGLSSAGNSRAKVKLDGSVDNYAPISISGEANFLAADTYSDIAMNFRNMELTTFNPYSGKFAGYSIAKGKLATEIHYQIQDRKLDATHHIVIDQLEFGAATDSKDAVPLPIKLAVSLLKDRNGVIDLNLPVNGSIDDPKFKVGPIIWKACLNLLTRIVTAPFSALGSLFGGGEELAYVDFAPGSASLSETEASKLGNLSKALIERPQLKLNIPLNVVDDADAAVMNQRAFDQALAPFLPGAASATPDQRVVALMKLHQNKLGSAPVLPAANEHTNEATSSNIAYLESILKPQFAISAADRDELTRSRAGAVQAALLANTELSAERIYLTAGRNKTSSPDGKVRMELQLE